MNAVRSIRRAAHVDEYRLRSGGSGRSQQTRGVGDYVGLGVRRAAGYSRNAFLQVDHD